MRWTGEPRKLRQEDYQQAVQDMVRGAQELGCVISVYISGSVSVPGISDLDVWFVFEDNASMSWGKFKQLLKPETLRPMLHTPFALHEKSFKLLSHITDTRGLELVWGKELALLPVEQALTVNSIIAARFAMARLISLSKAIFSQKAKVWSLLCQLNAVKHNYSLLGLEQPEETRQIEELRRSWFAGHESRYEKLSELIIRVQRLLVEFLRHRDVPGISGEGPGQFKVGHWRFGTFKAFEQRPGPLSWLGKNGKLSEIAFSSTRFTVPTHPSVIKGLVDQNITQLSGMRRFIAEHKVQDFPGFSPPYPTLRPAGFRRFVP